MKKIDLLLVSQFLFQCYHPRNLIYSLPVQDYSSLLSSKNRYPFILESTNIQAFNKLGVGFVCILLN